MPEDIEYIEPEDRHNLVNVTCFKLAEKTKDAYDAFVAFKEIEQQQLFLGSLDCTSEPTGRYAFVNLYLSTDEDDSSAVMTGPWVFARHLTVRKHSNGPWD